MYSSAPVEHHVCCIPGDTLVTATGIRATTERWYDGDLVIITTASRNKLTSTPNHPILTPQGWVASGMLYEGGYVISGLVSERFGTPAAGHSHSQNVPARIEDVAKAFRSNKQVSSMPMPITAEDFHGDGAGSEIAIVWADRLLGKCVDATCLQHSLQYNLRGRTMQLSSLYRSREGDLAAHGRGFPVNGSMGGAHNCTPLDGRILAPLQYPSLTVAADMNTFANQRFSHDFTGDFKRCGNRLHRLSTLVQSANTGIINSNLPSSGNTSSRKASSDGGTMYTELARQILDQPASGVFADEICRIERLPFSGHVYNLETQSGAYTANGIITHNCGCHDAGYVTVVRPTTSGQRHEVAPCDQCAARRATDALTPRTGVNPWYQAAHVPKRYWGATFATFSPKPDRLALGNARDYARNWPPTSPFLTLCSEQKGNGKTMLAVATAFAVWNNNRITARFWPVVELLARFRATFDAGGDASFAALEREMQAVPLLILDDIGAEKGSEWTRERLFALIDHRYRELLPMIVTSNVPLAQLEERVASRLRGGGVVAVLAGPDRRL